MRATRQQVAALAIAALLGAGVAATIVVETADTAAPVVVGGVDHG